MEFASDLVDILSQLQKWRDELVGAGYGNLPSVPGTAGDDTEAMMPEGAPQQEGMPGAVPAPMPAAAEVPTGEAGSVAGSPTKPTVSSPTLPITAPAKPRAAEDSRTIQRIADFERIQHGVGILEKVASFNVKMHKLGEDEMGILMAKSIGLGDTQKVMMEIRFRTLVDPITGDKVRINITCVESCIAPSGSRTVQINKESESKRLEGGYSVTESVIKVNII